MFFDAGKLFLETKPLVPFVPSNFKHWKQVFEEICVELEDRGFKQVYAMVDSQKKFDWCRFFGFQTCNLVIHDTIEIMIKEF